MPAYLPGDVETTGQFKACSFLLYTIQLGWIFLFFILHLSLCLVLFEMENECHLEQEHADMNCCTQPKQSFNIEVIRKQNYMFVMEYLLILVIIVSIIQKRYIDNRLRNGGNAINFIGAFNPFAAIHNVLPIRKDKYDSKFHSLAERGNLAILVFYISWALLIIIVLLDALL